MCQRMHGSSHGRGVTAGAWALTQEHGFAVWCFAGPGRINFKSLRPLPATLNAGGGGELLVGKAKQGLARRMMAVEQNM